MPQLKKKNKGNSDHALHLPLFCMQDTAPVGAPTPKDRLSIVARIPAEKLARKLFLHLPPGLCL